MIFVGIDDTDNAEQGGTGRVAREIAEALAADFTVLGVSRHQLLVDDRVPYTSNNSCNVIHLVNDKVDLVELADRIAPLLVERCLVGSDPGLCVADERVADLPFGRATQTELVTQTQALALAEELAVTLRPLGGTGDGVIGALAGVMLAAGGNDGRFVAVGRSRDLEGVVSVETLTAAGVSSVRTPEGAMIVTGLVDTNDGRVRPVLRDHHAVLLVESSGEGSWRVVEQGKGGAKRRKERESCSP